MAKRPLEKRKMGRKKEAGEALDFKNDRFDHGKVLLLPAAKTQSINRPEHHSLRWPTLGTTSVHWARRLFGTIDPGTDVVPCPWICRHAMTTPLLAEARLAPTCRGCWERPRCLHNAEKTLPPSCRRAYHACSHPSTCEVVNPAMMPYKKMNQKKNSKNY